MKHALVAGFALLAACAASAACAVGTTDTGSGVGADTTVQPTEPSLPQSGLPAGDAGNPTAHGSDSGAPDSGASGSGSPSTPSTPSGGGGGSGGACSGLAAPTVTAACNSCGTKHVCQANGCYGGYWCDVATKTCAAKPPGC